MLSSVILPVSVTPGAYDYLPYASTAGIFFLYDPKLKTVTVLKSCRDELRWHWELADPSTGYGGGGAFKTIISPYIGLTRGSVWDIPAFAARWDEIETMLNLTNRSSIHATDKTGAIILNLSAFWLENDTRRSLATLLIRMLAMNPTQTLDQAIQSYMLSRDVAPAIKWFLGGHTKPTYDRMTLTTHSRWVGFYNEMSGLTTPEQLITKLIKP